MEDLDKEMSKTMNIIGAMICIGFALVFLGYLLLRMPAVFLVGIVYTYAISAVQNLRRNKVREKFWFLGRKLHSELIKTEHYTDLAVMFWFGMMLGLFLKSLI